MCGVCGYACGVCGYTWGVSVVCTGVLRVWGRVVCACAGYGCHVGPPCVCAAWVCGVRLWVQAGRDMARRL